MKRGIRTIADLKARSIVDSLTGCWHYKGSKWKGTPRIHTFDYRKGDKTCISGPLAVWMIAHECAPLKGHLVYRSCCCVDCVNPVHVAQAASRKIIGIHVSRMGVRKGLHLESRRVNAAKGRASQGIVDTPAEVVSIILSSEDSSKALAEQFGIHKSTVYRIRAGERRA